MVKIVLLSELEAPFEPCPHLPKHGSENFGNSVNATRVIVFAKELIGTIYDSSGRSERMYPATKYRKANMFRIEAEVNWVGCKRWPFRPFNVTFLVINHHTNNRKARKAPRLQDIFRIYFFSALHRQNGVE